MAVNRTSGKSPRAEPKRYRREMILAVATELFEARGFHGVGIDDIGSAAGITGPGVYRHFQSKQEVLAAIIERATDALLSGGTEIASRYEGREALERLARFHADWVLSNRSAGLVYFQESKNLEPNVGRRLRGRQRLYLDAWSKPLAELRPDLAERERVLAVYAAINLINSSAFYRVDAEGLEALLAGMAIGALVAAEPLHGDE
jgi:AcrR family transcriptional regulator